MVMLSVSNALEDILTVYIWLVSNSSQVIKEVFKKLVLVVCDVTVEKLAILGGKKR